MYLNIVYLSQNSNGVQAAADAYFGKDVRSFARRMRRYRHPYRNIRRITTRSATPTTT